MSLNALITFIVVDISVSSSQLSKHSVKNIKTKKYANFISRSQKYIVENWFIHSTFPAANVFGMMSDQDDIIIDESRKNNFLSLKDKAEILERLETGVSGSQLAREYGISKSTVSRFKKRRDSIQKAVTKIFPNNTDRRTMRGTFHPRMEAALYKWYLEQCSANVVVTVPMIREQAQYFYGQFQESNYAFLASSGWIKNFKKRFGIKLPNDKPTKRKVKDTKKIHCETIEYLIETNNDECGDGTDMEQQITFTVKPKVDVINDELVDDAEAHRCLETVIKWSLQRSVDTLYLTMLRNLKAKARKGHK